MDPNNFYDFEEDYADYSEYETMQNHLMREDREEQKHVLTELISLLRSALNILELIYRHYNK